MGKQQASYFLGTLMFTPGRPQSVIDGQQRLATTMIFLAAVRDVVCGEPVRHRPAAQHPSGLPAAGFVDRPGHRAVGADRARDGDELVHPRHRDETTKAGHVRPRSRVIKNLQQQGLTTTGGRAQGDTPGGISWVQEVESSGVASWAYNAAKEIIVAVLRMLPENDSLPTGMLFRDRLDDIPR